MATNRRDMTVRWVPLGSRDAGESRVYESVAERLQLVDQLSESGWALSQRPLPTYSRATMPVVWKALGETAVTE